MPAPILLPTLKHANLSQSSFTQISMNWILAIPSSTFRCFISLSIHRIGSPGQIVWPCSMAGTNRSTVNKFTAKPLLCLQKLIALTIYNYARLNDSDNTHQNKRHSYRSGERSPWAYCVFECEIKSERLYMICTWKSGKLVRNSHLHVLYLY